MIVIFYCWVTLIILSAFFDAVSCGSCAEAKLCCPGRDSSCVVQKTPINAILEDVNEKPCYCDHACLKLGDCCSDFKKACNGESLEKFSLECKKLRLLSGNTEKKNQFGRCRCVNETK